MRKLGQTSRVQHASLRRADFGMKKVHITSLNFCESLIFLSHLLKPFVLPP
jgi:hypothetical protein